MNMLEGLELGAELIREGGRGVRGVNKVIGDPMGVADRNIGGAGYWRRSEA